MSNPIIAIKPLGFPWVTQDPFLFCVHHEDHYPAGNEQMGPNISLAGRPLGNDFTVKDGFRMYHGTKVPGFPAHPHRGFETVTVVNRGLIDHSDSLGAAGRFGNGDVQWMTAGKGVQHSEMFPLLNREGPNELELFQIWLNLPKKDKLAEPHFAMLWNDDIPVFSESDENGNSSKIKLIAGSWNDRVAPDPAPNSWAANPEHHVGIVHIEMEAKAQLVLPATAASVNRSIYFYKGKGLTIAGKKLDYFKAIEVRADTSILLENGDAPCSLLMLQGEPIKEPVVQYGPFVMNSEQEIQDAYYDFQRTQWGGWPWPSHEHVHPHEEGRFALHADGRLEKK